MRGGRSEVRKKLPSSTRFKEKNYLRIAQEQFKMLDVQKMRGSE